MRTWTKSVIFVATTLAAIGVAQQSSFAAEPYDDNAPMSSTLWNGPAYIGECGFANAGCQVSSNETIASSTDVDYFAVQCGSSTIKTVSITMVGSGSGTHDLDIEVRKPNYFSVVGTSTGTGLTETVNTSSANMNSLVLKVYGYNGATNTYGVNVTCN